MRPVLIVLGTLCWLALSGYKEAKTYYLTVDEFNSMRERFAGKNVRVAGNVAPNSIEKSPDGLRFTLEFNQRQIAVHYTGRSPVPDTFQDGTPAVVEGFLGNNQIFKAHQIQAKCASKYEARFSAKGSS